MARDDGEANWSLDGRGEEFKERCIGVGLCHRPAICDPKIDCISRITIGLIHGPTPTGVQPVNRARLALPVLLTFGQTSSAGARFFGTSQTHTCTDSNYGRPNPVDDGGAAAHRHGNGPDLTKPCWPEGQATPSQFARPANGPVSARIGGMAVEVRMEAAGRIGAFALDTVIPGAAKGGAAEIHFTSGEIPVPQKGTVQVKQLYRKGAGIFEDRRASFAHNIE